MAVQPVVHYDEEFIEKSVYYQHTLGELRVVRDALSVKLTELRRKKVQLQQAGLATTAVEKSRLTVTRQWRDVVDQIDVVLAQQLTHIHTCTRRP